MTTKRFGPNLSPETPADVAQALRVAFNALQDHLEAIALLKSQQTGGGVSSTTTVRTVQSSPSVGFNDLDMRGFRIVNLGNPTNALDAVNKQYADLDKVVTIATSATGAVSTPIGYYTIEFVTGGALGVTRTLPPAAMWTNCYILFKHVDAGVGVVKIVPDGVETIEGSTEYDLPNQYDYVELFSDGISIFILGSNA